MTPELMIGWGKFGAVAALAFGAMGSALGAGAAGPAAVGAWKRCLLQGKPAPFILVTFIGAPLSQTIYGMILMGALSKAVVATPTNFP
jgi:V/A-type H+-transporting ATPase subunit K